MDRFLLCRCHLQRFFQRYPVNCAAIYRSRRLNLCSTSACVMDSTNSVFRPRFSMPARSSICGQKPLSVICPSLVWINLPFSTKVYSTFRNVHLKEGNRSFQSINNKMSHKLGGRGTNRPLAQIAHGCGIRHQRIQRCKRGGMPTVLEIRFYGTVVPHAYSEMDSGEVVSAAPAHPRAQSPKAYR